MNPTNLRHISLQRVQQLYRSRIAATPDIVAAAHDPIVQQLDFALHNQSANFKLLHPLLIGKYARMTKHFRDTPFDTVGLDIETMHKTGEPRLMGFSFTDSYFKIDRPKLADFFAVIDSLIDNAPGTSLSVWGNLDIQCILRLFDPTDSERLEISRGISANFKKGKFVALPPVMRLVKKGDREIPFFVDHYIAGRSLRLGVQYGERVFTLWVFNLGQFYNGTISQTAQGLGMDWIEYPKNTHLVDWKRYARSETSKYHRDVIASNKQDAVTARDLCLKVQENFGTVFSDKSGSAYPTILVSVGSLADAAVSKMLNDQEYNSNSFRWLSYNIWRDSEKVAATETLCAEAFSAGYVDQFAIGYFPEVYMTDIAAAYPDKMRKLPDLRYSKIQLGDGNIRGDIAKLQNRRKQIFTAVIRGKVTIPESLKYHPITVKTNNRQNIRPIGTFHAAYTLEERKFCVAYGATFENEEYAIIYLDKNSLAPIAGISRKLKVMREGYIDQMNGAKNKNQRLVFDGMQYLTKIVDNSLYGKTVMSTPIVEDIEGTPRVTGYKAGDRYNQLYGAVITSRTRIQLAAALMAIHNNGGMPILAMTDSIFWRGNKSDIPPHLWRSEKTPGYFETPETLEDFYIIKTGQYEYRKGNKYFKKGKYVKPNNMSIENWNNRISNKFSHKMRGLNIPYEDRNSDSSYYRKIIRKHAKKESDFLHPQDFVIPVNTRRLVTIGSYDLHKLGLVEDKTSNMRPFVLSGKQQENYIINWRKCIDGFIELAPLIAIEDEFGDSPLAFLRGLHESGEDYLTTYQRKQMYLYRAALRTRKLLPKGKKLTDCTWKYLENYFGIKVEELVIYGNSEKIISAV